MKKIIIAGLLAGLFVAWVCFSTPEAGGTTALDGKIIALDAGHGGDDLGAQYPAKCADDEDPSDCKVYEKDVNLATVYALKDKLKAAGACVVLTRVCDEAIARRKDRVDIAEEKCMSECTGKCDVLVSIHHNGSTDPNYDGLLVIYNSPKDYELASKLHDRLLSALSWGEYQDEGYDKGGYGMTVYFSPASLTEGYYITNDWEAKQYLEGATTTVCTTADGKDYSVLRGAGDDGIDRIEQETTALYQGLMDYFGSSKGGSGNGNGKPDKCEPWPECK